MRGPRALACLLLSVSLAGCSNLLAPRPEPTKFYVLSASESGNSAAPPVNSRLVIGLGPIDFPQYLARTEMVTRSATNQIRISPGDHWAEPLDVTFSRVLSLDLSRALSGAQVVEFPAFGANYRFSNRVRLTVDRFETNDAGTAQLAARWEILEGKSGRSLYASSSDIREASTPGDAAAAAAALSQATAVLANQLAQAIANQAR